jgi:F0F1-type ATP synthase beta subunit
MICIPIVFLYNRQVLLLTFFLFMHTGKIKSIIGVVIDVEFSGDYVPNIYDALEVQDENKIILEVQQQLGDNVVRTIAMNPVDGLQRGLEVKALEAPISVPVGSEVLGRMFNVLGQPIDEKPAPVTKHKSPIHKPAPAYDELTTQAEIFETGVKVIDLVAPMLKGGKVGLFGGAGVGKNRHHARTHPQHRFRTRRLLCCSRCRWTYPWREWSLPWNEGLRCYR